MNDRANILLIMIESWDGRVIGCLGDPALKNVTPNVDKLASEGVLFKEALAKETEGQRGGGGA